MVLRALLGPRAMLGESCQRYFVIGCAPSFGLDLQGADLAV